MLPDCTVHKFVDLESSIAHAIQDHWTCGSGEFFTIHVNMVVLLVV